MKGYSRAVPTMDILVEKERFQADIVKQKIF